MASEVGTWKLKKLPMVILILALAIHLACGIKWLALGKTDTAWESKNRALQCRSIKNNYGLAKKQARVCKTTYEAMPQLAKAAKFTIETCQNLFENRRWNCSTLLLAPHYTPDLVAGTREQSYVYSLSSASVSYVISRACASGGLFNCSCATHPKDPPNGNFKWGGCGDNVKWASNFAKQFTDSLERTSLKEKGMKTKRGSHLNMLEHDVNVVMGSMGTHKPHSKSQLASVNLHNNKAGRRVVELSMKTQCKCHGVSGSCSIKICWKALPKFIEIGERLQKKYGSAIEVESRRTSSGRKLVPLSSNQKLVTDTDLAYILKSPDYCLRDDKTGSLGTRGRYCNATSSDYDSCDVMCCGRGYITITMQKIEMCRCKFHWCCKVVCKKCLYWIDRHICN